MLGSGGLDGSRGATLDRSLVLWLKLAGWDIDGGSSSYSSYSSSPQSFPSYEYFFASTQRLVFARLTLVLNEIGVPPRACGATGVVVLGDETREGKWTVWQHQQTETKV